ncbi:MAG: PDZ domain-containing protein, partial [Acidisphaera sp.]|nr:PDZ domain-containing protein [Acidisphaera sp.]
PRGAIVAAIDKDGPAAVAKLQQGDVILRFGKQSPKDMRALMRLVADATGTTVPLVIWRDGHEQTVLITITDWPESPAAPPGSANAEQPASQPPDLGLHAGLLTDEVRAKYDLAAAQQGVLLTEVAPRTIAADRGLKPGAVVLRVQEWPLTAPDDLLRRLDDARKANRRHVVLLVVDGDGSRWIPLPLN